MVIQQRDGWNALAQQSHYKVGGFPPGAVNPAARQTLHGSFSLPGCGLHSPDKTHGFILFAVLFLPQLISPALLENKKLSVKTWPLVHVLSVCVDINHCFMEVSVGVYETCELRVFLFLTQITEKYLEVRATEELEVVVEVGGWLSASLRISASNESSR